LVSYQTAPLIFSTSQGPVPTRRWSSPLMDCRRGCGPTWPSPGMLIPTRTGSISMVHLCPPTPTLPIHPAAAPPG